METVYDAAVLGAGIAGSGIAKALADKGWRVLLIDRQRFPRHKVCGEFLSPESLSSLRSLGLSNTVASLQPCAIQRARLVLSHGAVIEMPLPGTALGVSRYALDAALHEAALCSGAHIVTGEAALGLHGDENRYSIVTKGQDGNRTYYARAVIAAWGGHQGSSRIARSAGSPAGAEQSYVGIKSHYKGIEMEPAVELYFFSGGYLGLCPVEGGAVNAAALLTRKAAGEADKSVAGMIAYAAARNNKLAERLKGGLPVSGTQKAAAPVDPARKLAAWGAVPQAGDAAVMIPPLCGDGMSMALRSAQLCAHYADRYLCGEMALSDWQKLYTAALEREFAGPIYWGRMLQSLFAVPVLPRLMAGMHAIAPGMTNKIVRLTRLNI